MKHHIRYLAHITLEAATPLAVGSGSSQFLTDSPILRDANGLPIIHGTAISGVVRSIFRDVYPKETENDVFGFQDENANEDNDLSCGSRLIVSHAHILNESGKAVEGLSVGKSDFLKIFEKLPIRQHCKINHKGAADAKAHGKFDSQVVFKGTRFKFSLEFLCREQQDDVWQNIVNVLSAPSFRLGGGSRKGFGSCKIVDTEVKKYDLSSSDDLKSYLTVHSLNTPLDGDKLNLKTQTSDSWKKYTLKLQPETTWMFSSGFGDEDADNTPVSEACIRWENGKCDGITHECFLVPATSIKGALSHRVAFHYNSLCGHFADKLTCFDNHIGEKNTAVKSLFGCAKNSKDNEQGQRGNVIISDLFLEKLDLQKNTKVFNHVALDRFTQAPIDGAFFNEKVVFDLEKKQQWNLEILVNVEAFGKEHVQQALEKALDDITTGMLPLGGSVMKGHGIFTGELKHA